MPFYHVNILFPMRIGQTFTYLYSTEKPLNVVGFRVIVPWGTKLNVGIIVEQYQKEYPDYDKYKNIYQLADTTPFLPKNLIKVIHFISSYYIIPLGNVLHFVLPKGTLPRVEKKIILNENTPLEELQKYIGKSKIKYQIYKYLKNKKSTTYTILEKVIGKTIRIQVNELQKNGVLLFEYQIKEPRVREYKQTYVLPISPQTQVSGINKNAFQQKRLFSFLCKQRSSISQKELTLKWNFSRTTIESLKKKNIIKTEEITFERKSSLNTSIEQMIHTMTPEQKKVIQQIAEAPCKKPYLLYGVTGSGKTLVYINILSEIIKKGQTAIVLIPEISLTPQTVSRFRSRFGNLITILNSKMTSGEKYDSWRLMRDGKYPIVIGPRSAIFSPLQNIGLIIVDEEHEWTYKQTEQSPFYNARDIAVYRAKQENCPIILGSATPSLESFHNAKKGKYHLLQLLKRPQNATLPKVEIVDLKKELKYNPTKENLILSEKLEKEIEYCLMKKEQIILFQNKRGYSTYLCCDECGHIQECASCSISLVYHKKENILKCHYCGYKTPLFLHCQDCKKKTITFLGFGTQKVEEYLIHRFPSAQTIRMDSDTTRGNKNYQKILQKFNTKQASILLGTQMIAKGLDFPNVTLVGVLSADASLSIPDFRSAERTCQILSQVAGRSGRSKKHGKVIIQTFQPTHYVIKLAKEHDYISFFKKEYISRSNSFYPPQTRLINIKFQSESENEVHNTSENFKNMLLALRFDGIKVLGPAMCFIEKIRNQYRKQILLKIDEKYKEIKKLKYYLFTIQQKLKSKNQNCHILIDVDPYDLI